MGGTSTGKFNVEQLGRVTHEANRAFETSTGDIPLPPWENLGMQGKSRAYQVITDFADLLTENPDANGPEAHQVWLDVMTKNGWTKGPASTINSTHPGLVPFAELNTNERVKRFIFAGIIRAVWDNDDHHFR